MTEEPGRTPEHDPADAAAFRMVGKSNVPTYWVDSVEYWSIDSVTTYINGKGVTIDDPIARRMVIAGGEQEFGN